jgi:hypothetical protein
MSADYYNPKPFLEELFRHRPDCTLSFNGLLPDDQGRFFCDMIKIPHVACLVDAPNAFLPLVSSAYTLITCPDRFGCEFFQGLNCQNVLFLPHATGKDETHPAAAERPLDVVMLGSCFDYEGRRASWKEQFPETICRAMEDAVELTFADQHTPYVQAFVNALDLQFAKLQSVDLKNINYPMIFEELDAYLRGRDRVALLRAIKDAHVHVYGSSDDNVSWQDYIGDQSNIEIHPSVDFHSALEIMKQAKIVLNSSPHLKNGAHERIFSGFAHGALVVTAENIYLREQFKDGQDIVFYRYNQWDNVNAKINHYLQNESERCVLVERAQKIVAAHHTWDQRAQVLLKEIAPLLAGIA